MSPGVFFQRTTPLQVAPAQVRGLRLSLNTPIVSTEDLPIGPARAAILIHAEGQRGETVTVGVRSLRASRVALFSVDPDVSGDASFDVTLDAALSFAESMGFLFDEDEVGDGGAQARTRCLGLWRDLIGDDAPLGKPAAAPETDELLLEDMVEDATEAAVPPFGVDANDASFDAEIGDFGPSLEGEPEPELEAPRLAAAPAKKKALRAAPSSAGRDKSESTDAAMAADLARVAAGGGGRSPSLPAPGGGGRSTSLPAAGGGGGRSAPLTLSKFRGTAASAEPPAEASAKAAAKPGRPAALGRLRLVRRGKDGVRKRNPILRLFGVF
jgi:hypothetical protein